MDQAGFNVSVEGTMGEAGGINHDKNDRSPTLFLCKLDCVNVKQQWHWTKRILKDKRKDYNQIKGAWNIIVEST